LGRTETMPVRRGNRVKWRPWCKSV